MVAGGGTILFRVNSLVMIIWLLMWFDVDAILGSFVLLIKDSLDCFIYAKSSCFLFCLSVFLRRA